MDCLRHVLVKLQSLAVTYTQTNQTVQCSNRHKFPALKQIPSLALRRRSDIIPAMKARPSVIASVVLCLFTFTTKGSDFLLAGFAADAIVRYDSSGTLVGTFASDPAMDGPTAMVYNTAGNLLVLNEFFHNVLKFDGTTGALIGTLISSTTLGGAGVTDPDDMEIGPDGNLYVTSHFNTGVNIAKFDGLTGAYLSAFAFNPPTNHHHGLAFGPGGNLFQGNVDTGRVERFDGATGAFLGNFTTGAPVSPIAELAFGPSHLYVTLDGAGGGARFDATSGAFISYLIAPDTFASYWGILVDGTDLYLANKSTGTVKKYDATTDTFLGDFITGGPAAFDIIAMPVPEPAGEALLFLGLVFVASMKRRPQRQAI